MRIRLTAALAALAIVFATPLAAQSEAEVNARLDTIFGEHETLADAFAVVQQAVSQRDAETVASLVKYPFEVTIDGEAYVLESEQDFVERYDEIVTEKVAAAVETQDYGDLFVNQDGVMFGQGEMWLTSVCTDDDCSSAYWVISAINM